MNRIAVPGSEGITASPDGSTVAMATAMRIPVAALHTAGDCCPVAHTIPVTTPVRVAGSSARIAAAAPAPTCADSDPATAR